MNLTRKSDVWWRNAVFYCLDVETYQDGNDDGIGDFHGLTQRIDHLARLGVNCLWLMPFFPTPNRDDGYDITDYYSVDPRLGSLGDFVECMRMARSVGIRVITDLVVNHTSDQHPWFQAARADPKSTFRDWYVWSDTIPDGGPSDLIFPGAEDSNWEWDEVAGQFYLHRFYRHQPDLNIANEHVREEIRKIVGFWLELGVSGFRVDAVPFLIETAGIVETMEIAPHEWLRDLRGFASRRRGDAVMMGEVNLEYEQTRRFFGGDRGGELNMCLNFNLNQAMALALVREDTGPLIHSLRAMPEPPDEAAWATFVRNHDEWSLDKLTEAERAEVFRAFGPKPEMQIFGRGLRRRLPTMLGGDQKRIRLVYSLAFGLPGAPVLFYGEEIGMAENLDIPGRLSVRAPMQWEDAPNGGFSNAPPEELRRPVVSGRKWGPAAISVTEQERDPDSLLSWMQRLITRRATTPEIGFGAWSILPSPEAALIALRYDWHGETVLTFHNLGRQRLETQVSIDDAADWASLADLFGNGEVSLRAGALRISLPGYGSNWSRVRRARV